MSVPHGSIIARDARSGQRDRARLYRLDCAGTNAAKNEISWEANPCGSSADLLREYPLVLPKYPLLLRNRLAAVVCCYAGAPGFGAAKGGPVSQYT